MRSRMPYGRRDYSVAALLAIPLIFFGLAAVQKANGELTRASWAKLALLTLGAAYCFGAFAVFLYAHPRQRGQRADARIVLRIPLWRRLLFATMLPGAFGIGNADVLLRGEAPLKIAAALAGTGVVCLALTTERVAFSAEGIQRLAGLGARHSIAWGETSRLVVAPAAMVVHGASGQKIAVMGLWLDGYPELVAAVLERAPKQVLRALDEEHREQLLCIAELVDPAGTARH